jgi:RNA polymerase sigma-70 factor (ECF subfamily)
MTGSSAAEERVVVAAAQAGDEAAFAGLVERHQRELQVHCYRMLGSFEDSEDMVQETFLRAWRKRATFQGRSTFRAWLYRIATNACLDFLDRHPRRPRQRQPVPASNPAAALAPVTEVPWLQPYPDRLLEPIAPGEAEPDAAVVANWLVRHALRSAVKRGNPEALEVLGFVPPKAVSVRDIQIAPEVVPIGDSVTFTVELANEGPSTERLLVDLRVYFVKANEN